MARQHTPDFDPRPKNYIGSTLLFLGIFSTATIAGFLIIVGMVTTFKIRWQIAHAWCAIIGWMTKVFCGLTYEVEGMEHIDPQQPAIILSNHQSAWETLALRSILPAHSVVIKRELLLLPIWGWALLALKSIVINRKNQRAALRSLLTKGSQYLDEGLWVLVFPEGTRAGAKELLKFNVGGAMLAHKTGVPVIPVAHNAGDFWPRYSFFKYPGVIKLKIGAPIATQGRKATDINAEAEAWIRQALQEMG